MADISPVSASSLLASLNQTKIKSTDPALYEVIKRLVMNIDTNNKSTSDAVNANSGTIAQLTDAELLTADDEHVLLPLSRQLLPGTNISFDDSLPNKRTVNASGSGGGGTSGPSVVLFEDNANGDFSSVIPGPKGDTGATGATGAQGSSGLILLSDIDAPIEPLLIPGPQGVQGSQGQTGNNGIPGMDGVDGEDHILLSLVNPLTGMTLGSVPFIGPSSYLAQNNSKLFWDNTNNRLGVGTNSPTNAIEVQDTGTVGAFTRNSAGNGFNSNSLILQRDNAFSGGTPTNNDGTSFLLRLKQANGTYCNVGSIRCLITDVTNNVATGLFILCAKPAGNPASVFETPIFRVGTDGAGYFTGVGGTVTQATNKSTGVTLNTLCGQITMNNAALAAATTVSFIFTNSNISSTDLLLVNHVSGGTAGSYLFNSQCGVGSAMVNVRNISSGSLSEAIVISFALIKSVTS